MSGLTWMWYPMQSRLYTRFSRIGMGHHIHAKSDMLPLCGHVCGATRYIQDHSGTGKVLYKYVKNNMLLNFSTFSLNLNDFCHDPWVVAQQETKSIRGFLMCLDQERLNRADDDYGANALLRRRHRSKRKEASIDEAKARGLGLAVELVQPSAEDAAEARAHGRAEQMASPHDYDVLDPQWHLRPKTIYLHRPPWDVL